MNIKEKMSIYEDETLSNLKLPMTGILLVGGESSRMRTNKAFLELGGKPIIEKSLEVLEELFEEVLISANDTKLYEKYGKRVVPDLFQGHGPLGGIHSGLKYSEFERVFFVACDMPFLNKGIIRCLAEKTADYDIIIPSIEGKIHPLHGFYHKRCGEKIEEHLTLGIRKIIRLYPYFRVYYAQREELEDYGDVDLGLSNINTPDEWQKIINREG